MKRDEEWQPERFDWRREIGKGYGAYLVYSDVDRTRALFEGGADRAGRSLRALVALPSDPLTGR